MIRVMGKINSFEPYSNNWNEEHTNQLTKSNFYQTKTIRKITGNAVT